MNFSYVSVSVSAPLVLEKMVYRDALGPLGHRKVDRPLKTFKSRVYYFNNDILK